jgi:hypothetical protein
MKFVTPTVEELSYLRADPLLWEQELDSAQGSGIDRTCGGTTSWKSLLAVGS